MFYLLIIYFSIKYKAFLRKVLSNELVLIYYFLAISLFNFFNTGTIVDVGHQAPFWIVLTINPFFIYGQINNKKYQYLLLL